MPHFFVLEMEMETAPHLSFFCYLSTLAYFYPPLLKPLLYLPVLLLLKLLTDF